MSNITSPSARSPESSTGVDSNEKCGQILKSARAAHPCRRHDEMFGCAAHNLNFILLQAAVSTTRRSPLLNY